MKPYLPYLFLVGAMLPGDMTLEAQQPPPLNAARVTLITGDAPSKGGRTEVVRQARGEPQNVVVVDRNASADDLAAALAIVNAMRAQHGDSLIHDFRARPDRVKHGALVSGSDYRKWLNDQLVRLRKAPDRELGLFGVVKAVQITLPPPAGSVANPAGKS